MKSRGFNLLFCLILYQIFVLSSIEASQQNKSIQPAKKEANNNGVLIKKLTAYRAFQPAYHRLTFNKIDMKPDYDRSYDAEYDGMVSNFTSSIYDDNPPIYPNPDSYQSQQVPQPPNLELDSEVDLPDDSLADGDLRDHNIIDSITYVYGFTSCKCKPRWKILILIATAISILLMSFTMFYLICTEAARKFRTTQIYVTSLNLCGCLQMCTVIYFQAALGSVGPWWCERVALVLHYVHVSTATWILLLAHDLHRVAARAVPRPIPHHYLVGYGLTGLLVMFNYALSMEHYETKHYCWMSLEKGMVIGFMAPVMVLILMNTIVVMQGLKKINKIQSEELHTKLQELIDQHFSNMKKNEPRPGTAEEQPPNESPISIQSRKHTDSSSSDYCDKYSSSEDEGHNYIHHLQAQHNMEEKYNLEAQHNMEEKYYETQHHMDEKYNYENGAYLKNVTEQDILNFMYFDRLANQSQGVLETSHIKSLLQMSLVMSPFFAVNWVLGVVALENSDHWPTPALYLITLQIMVIYVSVSLCTNLPSNSDPQPPDGPTNNVERQNSEEHSVVVVTNVLVRARSNCMKNLKLSRSIDIVPLLDPKPPTPSTGQTDTISTISI